MGLGFLFFWDKTVIKSINRRLYQKHDSAPFSLYNRSTTASPYISDQKKAVRKTRKTTVRRVPCLCKVGCVCVRTFQSTAVQPVVDMDA
jgi:hypothetical protein